MNNELLSIRHPSNKDDSIYCNNKYKDINIALGDQLTLRKGLEAHQCDEYQFNSFFMCIGLTGLVNIDFSGRRSLNYSVYDMQKYVNGTKFVPILEYDSYSKSLRQVQLCS